MVSHQINTTPAHVIYCIWSKYRLFYICTTSTRGLCIWNELFMFGGPFTSHQGCVWSR